MNFEQRKQEAMNLVVDFLCSFSAPRGLGEDQMAKRIAAISEAFARRMPVRGNYSEAIEKVFDKIRDTHLSNSWPAQAVFVNAMPQGEVTGPKAAETFSPRQAELAAQKMRNHEAVGERFVWGSGAATLSREGLVSSAVIDKYRVGSVASYRKTHGHFADDILVRNFGAVVMPYLGDHA